VAFANVATALDAWTDDPDPRDGPYQRTLSERRADALDDLARHGLHSHDDDDHFDADPEFEDITAEDTFDGFCPHRHPRRTARRPRRRRHRRRCLPRRGWAAPDRPGRLGRPRRSGR
jgi:hypothetical protein